MSASLRIFKSPRRNGTPVGESLMITLLQFDGDSIALVEEP